MKRIISYITHFDSIENANEFVKQYNFTREAKERLIQALQADNWVEAGKYEKRMD